MCACMGACVACVHACVGPATEVMAQKPTPTTPAIWNERTRMVSTWCTATGSIALQELLTLPSLPNLPPLQPRSPHSPPRSPSSPSSLPPTNLGFSQMHRQSTVRSSLLFVVPLSLSPSQDTYSRFLSLSRPARLGLGQFFCSLSFFVVSQYAVLLFFIILSSYYSRSLSLTLVFFFISFLTLVFSLLKQ